MKNTPQPHTGRILELRQTQAVVQDIASGRHWGLPYAAVLAEPTTAAQQPPHASPPPPPQAKRPDQLNKALAEPSLYDDVLTI